MFLSLTTSAVVRVSATINTARSSVFERAYSKCRYSGRVKSVLLCRGFVHTCVGIGYELMRAWCANKILMFGVVLQAEAKHYVGFYLPVAVLQACLSSIQLHYQTLKQGQKPIVWQSPLIRKIITKIERARIFRNVYSVCFTLLSNSCSILQN